MNPTSLNIPSTATGALQANSLPTPTQMGANTSVTPPIQLNMPSTATGALQANSGTQAQNNGNPIVNFAKGVVAPIQNFGGEMAAGSVPGQNIQSSINQSNQEASNSDYNLLKTWNAELQQAAQNGDTTRVAQLKSNLANFQFQDGTKMTDVFPNINDTDEQVIGNAIGTGLLAMSGGGLEAGGEAVAGAAKGTQTLAQAIKSGVAVGSAYGAIGGGASAMGQNASAGGVAENTVAGGATGAVLGGATGGLLHGASALISNPSMITDAASNLKEAISPTLTPEEQVGQIIQGKAGDIAPAQRTFDALGTDVKTLAKTPASELSDTIQTKLLDANRAKVDTLFKNDTNLHPMSDFDETIGKGKSAVTSNYVQQAIDQLKDFYAKTNDAEGLSAIKALEEKATTEGLTSKDLNDLAKEHGSTINAFNANGEASSGLTKQAAENTRSGVKGTARRILGETDSAGSAEVTKLDKQTSEAIKTKNLLDKKAQVESTKVQKYGKPGILKKFVSKHPYLSGAIGGGTLYGAAKKIGIPLP